MASAPDDPDPHRREVALGSAPASSQHPVHGGHADEHRAPAPLDGVEHASGRNRGRNQTGMPAAARPTRVTNPMMWAIGQADDRLVVPARPGPERARRRAARAGPGARARRPWACRWCPTCRRASPWPTGRRPASSPSGAPAVELVERRARPAWPRRRRRRGRSRSGRICGVDRDGDAAGPAHGQAGQELVVGVGGGDHDPVPGDRPGRPMRPARASTRSAASAWVSAARRPPRPGAGRPARPRTARGSEPSVVPRRRQAGRGRAASSTGNTIGQYPPVPRRRPARSAGCSRSLEGSGGWRLGSLKLGRRRPARWDPIAGVVTGNGAAGRCGRATPVLLDMADAVAGHLGRGAASSSRSSPPST